MSVLILCNQVHVTVNEVVNLEVNLEVNIWGKFMNGIYRDGCWMSHFLQRNDGLIHVVYM